VSRGSTTDPLTMVRAMIAAGDSPLLTAELAHALRLKLQADAQTPTQRRLGDLGALARILRSSSGYAIEQYRYDELRPAGDPSARQLIGRYGSWFEACSIALSMRPDGRLPLGGLYCGGIRRGIPSPRYTRDQVIGAVRRCAFALGRRPSSTEYARWVAASRRRARETGRQLDLPWMTTLLRHFRSDPNPWRHAFLLAAITDSELSAAREALVPGGPHPAGRDFGQLPLSEAATLAANLHGSLDWLAGRTADQGTVPHAGLRFDGHTFRELRARVGIPVSLLRERLDLNLGDYRRLLAGTLEPTLSQAADLASLLGVETHRLCQPHPRRA
jgi:hypothetical protein